VFYVIDGDEVAREDVGADEAVASVETLADVATAHHAEVCEGVDEAVLELNASDAN
jgi:hypothetical protein